MARKFPTFVAALAVAVTAFAPSLAEARDHDGGYYRGGGGYDRGYYDGRGRGDYHHHDDGDAVAAGVIGLALGAIIGSAVTANNQAPRRYYSPPRAYYPPPPADYYPPPPPQGYYGDGPGYASRGCVVRERVWDPYAGQYVRVEHPC